jgi:hypothetical protein
MGQVILSQGLNKYAESSALKIKVIRKATNKNYK